MGAEELLHSVFSVVEALAQHPNILDEHHALVIEKLLPPLASLVASSNGKYSGEGGGGGIWLRGGEWWLKC